MTGADGEQMVLSGPEAAALLAQAGISIGENDQVGTVSGFLSTVHRPFFRAMDPDPHGSAFIFPTGSRKERLKNEKIKKCKETLPYFLQSFQSWIRIRIKKGAGSGSAKNECGHTALPFL